MRYNAFAALRYNALSVSCILLFSVSWSQSHFLCLSASRAEDIAPGLSGCWHGSFSIYCDLLKCHPTLVIYLSAILHTCLSSTSCSPRRATTAHKISVYVRVKSKYAAYSLRLSGRASMQAGGYDEEGKTINAVARGKLGDLLSIKHWQVSEKVLYTARLKHWVQSENNVHVKRHSDLGYAKN